MSARTLVAEYHYCSADGTVLATHQRYDPKSLPWVSPRPGGGTVSGLNGLKQCDLPLFRLPELLASAPGSHVLMAEGEKDVMTLVALGFNATTMSEGAGTKTFPPAKFEPLRYRQVYIFADNDDAGREFRNRVTEVLGGIAAYVYHPELPNLPEKGDVTDWVDAGGTREALQAILDGAVMVGGNGELEPPVVCDGAALADEVFDAIKRFVVMGDDATVASTLWCMHTHAFAGSEAFTPYLAVTSPGRGCGKTTVIDVLASLAAEPKRADSVTPAVIYRMVDRGRGQGNPVGPPPTLFLDELDAAFGGGGARSERSEAMRLVLNSGFKRDGVAVVCEGDNNVPREYVTYCPKLLAGIGKLPDTVADRSIPIRLAKATNDERKAVIPARARTLAQLEPLRRALSVWARDAVPRLQARPEPYIGLSARQDDIWGPLLNIADDIGGAWPQRARQAARALHAETGDITDGLEPGAALLSDLRDVFAEDRATFVSSARLAELLRLMEDRPWPEWSRNGPITVRAIAVLLSGYGIRPRLSSTLLLDGKRGRGYYLDDCREAFQRYLPPPAGETVHPFIGGHSPSENAMNSLTNGTPSALVREPNVAPFDDAAVQLAAAGYPADW